MWVRYRRSWSGLGTSERLTSSLSSAGTRRNARGTQRLVIQVCWGGPLLLSLSDVDRRNLRPSLRRRLVSF